MRILIVGPQDTLETLGAVLSKYGPFDEIKGAESGYLARGLAEEVKPQGVSWDGQLEDGLTCWNFAQLMLNMEQRPYMAYLDQTESRRNKALCEEFGITEYLKAPVELNILLEIVCTAGKKGQVRSDP